MGQINTVYFGWRRERVWRENNIVSVEQERAGGGRDRQGDDMRKPSSLFPYLLHTSILL